MALRFELNGEIVNNPLDPKLDEISILADWSENVSEAEINTQKFIWADSEATKIKEFINSYSRLQGMPFRIYSGSFTVFDGYLDLRDSVIQGQTSIETTAEKRYGSGWFNGRTQAISFESLYNEGIIKNSDFVYIPYVINYVPDGVQVMIISLTLFTLSKELYEAIERLNKATTNALELIPDIIAGTAVEILKVGKIAAIVLELVFQLAYIVAMVAAIIKLINDLAEQFFPQLRYYAGIKYRTLWVRSMEKLGLGFSSTIYENSEFKDAVYIPFKDQEGTKTQSGQTGYPKAQDPIYTVANFIENERKKFNAKYKISNGVLTFERADFWENKSEFILPDVVTNQATKEDDLQDNSNEFVGLYKINFSTDANDRNTVVNYRGTNVLISTSLENTIDVDLDLTQGGIEIFLAEARGTRKDDLNKIEKLVRGLFKFVDNLTGVFGKGTNFAAKVDNRIGALNLSDATISVPKMVIAQGNKIKAGQNNIVNARKLWNEFHYINSFAPINGVHNQYFVFKGVKFGFYEDDFNKLIGNNYFKTESNEDGEIERLEWLMDGGGAVADFRIKKTEPNTNFKINIYEG